MKNFLKILQSSILKIKDANIQNSEIGIVAKDSSDVVIENYQFETVKVPLAAFIKKPELGPPRIDIKNSFNNLPENSLVSIESIFFFKGIRVNGSSSSIDISKSMYGNIYGVKTIR